LYDRLAEFVQTDDLSDIHKTTGFSKSTRVHIGSFSRITCK